MSEAITIPSILEDLDNYRSRIPDGTILVAQHAVLKFVRILDHLAQWYQGILSASQGTLWWPISNTDGETSLWFSSISMANCLTHFWAFWIICITNARGLRTEHASLKEIEIEVDGIALESELISERIIERSTWILQSIEFLTQDEMKLYGVASVYLPLQTACDILKRNDNCSRSVWTVIGNINKGRYRDILKVLPDPLIS